MISYHGLSDDKGGHPIIGFDAKRFSIQRNDAGPGKFAGVAVFDKTGCYRYFLAREWDYALPACLFIMLNPSTADAFKLDPTVRRCYGYAQEWGCGALFVMNAFAWRATRPEVLKVPRDPLGPDNDALIEQVVQMKGIKHVVAAWGRHARYRNRSRDLVALLKANYCKPEILWSQKWQDRVTQNGGAMYPRHPLYLPKTDTLIAYEGAG